MTKPSRRVFASLCGVAVVLIMLMLAVGSVQATAEHVRWDIIQFTSVHPRTFAAGGTASALAQDGSMITLTGSGTFTPGEDGEVTGGGTWATQSPSGATIGSGTYQVTGLIKFDVAPGGVPSPPFVDLIGPAANAHAGLAFLRIRYSDGSRGVLTVSCTFVGTPPNVFEGITASKDFVDYFMRVPQHFTLFHFISAED